jgi:hypothetical protein
MMRTNDHSRNQEEVYFPQNSGFDFRIDLSSMLAYQSKRSIFLQRDGARAEFRFALFAGWRSGCRRRLLIQMRRCHIS